MSRPVHAPRFPASTFPLLASALAAALVLTGCKHEGAFVWANDYKGTAEPSEYLVHPGDTLLVRVYNQDAMTTRTRVRADGKISLPFLNDVTVAGFAPSAIALQLSQRLKDFLVKPTVTVSLEEVKPLSVSIVGEVVRPGQYSLEPGVSLLHALASAGGFSEFASRDSIYVLRRDSAGAPPKRIRFRFHELIHVEGPSARFRLQPGDALVIE